MALLSEHIDGCTPLIPCAACQAAAFLRSKLSADDIVKLSEILAGAPMSMSEKSLSVPGTPIQQFDVPVRVFNALFNHGVRTIEELETMTWRELSRVPGCGRQSVSHVISALNQRGKNLREE